MPILNKLENFVKNKEVETYVATLFHHWNVGEKGVGCQENKSAYLRREINIQVRTVADRI